MRLHHLFAVAALLCVSSSLPLRGQLQAADPVSVAITADPTPDKTNPAAMQTFQIPSHGALLNALTYVAAGPGPHPVVLLLHGFPGNEKNLDLAQTLRRAGWDVVYFDYRGSWGSPGDFSFTHSLEDTNSAIAYIRDPANAKKLRADPNYIVLIGHSMGGFMALQAGANDPAIKAIVAISAADFGASQLQSIPAGQHDAAVKGLAAHLAEEGMAPLARCTPEGLAREVVANAAKWAFPSLVPKLMSRPLLVVTSDDGLAPVNDALVEALRSAGDTRVTTTHMPTGHSYSDHRIALQQAVLDALSSLQK
jgi:pimeloyl-ACP methyl ester carboxylesterase